MFGNNKEHASTGTTSPIKIPKGQDGQLINKTGDLQDGQSIKAGSFYFLIKIHAAQAAYLGSLWEKAKQLVVTSNVALNSPAFGNEATRSIQRARKVKRGGAEQLGLATNLIELTPAIMDRVSLSIEFLLDKENRLGSLSNLINDDAFVNAISLAPGAVAIAKTIGKLSQKIINTFFENNERQPILQFSCDFNILAGDLSNAYYVILGTRDDKHPLPRPLPEPPNLKVQGHDLLLNDKSLTDMSYIILDVTVVEARTKELGRGESWYKKLMQVETLVDELANNPFPPTDDDCHKAWDECNKLIKEAGLLLGEDALFTSKEAKDIIRKAYLDAKIKILEMSPPKLALVAPPIMQTDKTTRLLLGVDNEEMLLEEVRNYEDAVKRVEPTLRSLSLLP